MTNFRKDIYKRITDQVIENLEKAGSWQKLWSFQQPLSLNSHPYRGINHLLLSVSLYSSPVWGTFNQVRQNGGKVNKGEKSSLVVFWKRLEKTITNPQTGKTETKDSFILRYYNVFNSRQCTFDKIGEDKIQQLTGEAVNLDNKKHVPSEKIVDNFPGKPLIRHGNFNPCYVPSLDEVRMPELKNFSHSQVFYDALFHELVHSTGHKKRLDRDLSGISGSHEYSKEELVAEMGSAFLCSISGIEADIKNSAAYIKSWLKVLQDNPSWVTLAASKAQKACEHIIPSLAQTSKENQSRAA